MAQRTERKRVPAAVLQRARQAADALPRVETPAAPEPETPAPSARGAAVKAKVVQALRRLHPMD